MTRAVSVGELLAATQAVITTATNTLLGRVSLGPGGPEPVPMGTGVAINSGALSANGADHAGFVQRSVLTLSDEIVLNSSGTPSRMPLPMLRGLFAAGTNVSIDGTGTISAATDPAVVATLGTVGAQAAAAQSASGSATAAAGTLAVTVTALGSQVGTVAGVVAPLGGQIGTLSTTVSTVSSTVAGQTAQIGTLSAGVSAAGSLAAAASNVAASAGSSVSTLGSQVGMLSSAVAPLGGQIGTLSATVSSVGSTVAAQTTQLGTLSAGVSAAGSLAAAAASAAASAGSSVSTLGSTVGTLSSVVAPLSGQVGTLSTTVSAVSSTVAAQTTQLGTLSAGVSAANSLAAAAASAAASAGSSVSTLGSTVGTLSSVVAPLSGQVGTLSATVSSVGSTVAAHTAQLGTLSAGVSAAGSLAAAASSAAASAGSSVSTLGSTVGTLSSAVAAGVIAGSSTAGSTTTLTNVSGGTIVTIVAPAGPPGTLGNGSVRTNTASAFAGGPERTLQAIHSDRLRLKMFGAQQNGTTAQGLLGVTTRAQLAAWTNPAGAKPYAFAATQPFTMGDDYWVRLPAGIASGSTVNLSATLTLGSAGYQGQDGHWYLPAPNAGYTYFDDMVVTGGNLAAGTRVVATQGATIRITDQPAGTAIPSGTVLTVGADMTKVKVGQQVWATRGLAPLCLITAVSSTTITLSTALAAGGLGTLQTLNIYTPMSENTLTNSVTMDMLALCAAYYAAPYGGVVECDPGGYIFSPHVILAGGNVKLIGAGRHCCTMSGTDNAPLIKMFPQNGAETGVMGLNFGNYAGLMQSFVEIDGGGFGVVAPNGVGCGAVIDDLSGNCSPGPIGAYELVRLRNLGNVRFDNVDFIGLGKTTVGACTLNAGSVILMISRNVTSHYCWRAAIQQGYIEDPICEHWAQDQCGAAWDASRANTFNGICGLLFKWVGGDNDISEFILYLQSFSGVNISDACVIFNGQNGGACYILAGCASGVIVGVQGGTVAPGVVDCIHLTSGMVDGGYYPCTNILVSGVGVSGFDCAVRLDKGCFGNDVTATLWSGGVGSTNGISPAPVIDSDGRNRVNGVMGTAH
ncbi:MAG: hypothetical protein ACRYG6_10670 [Janthinobacterium lividum]